MHSDECIWCRAHTKRLEDEDIINQFDLATATNNEPLFQATFDPLQHTQYHKDRDFGLQHADAMDAVNGTIERLWVWLKGKSPDGKHIVSRYYSMNLGWKRKKTEKKKQTTTVLVGGVARRIAQRMSKQQADQLKALAQLRKRFRIKTPLQELLATPNAVVEMIPSLNAGPDKGIDGRLLCPGRFEKVMHSAEDAIEPLYRMAKSAKGTPDEDAVCTMIFKAVACFTQDCLKKHALPILFSQGLRIPCGNGTSDKLLTCRLALCVSSAKRPHGNPLERIKREIPSLTVMARVMNKEFFSYIQQFPEWNKIKQNTFRQQLNRTIDTMFNQNLLEYILYPVKGDDNGILYMS